MLGQIQIRVGQQFSCKYPKNGSKNILCNQKGEVESFGTGWLRVKRDDGSYRTLRFEKMVQPVIKN